MGRELAVRGWARRDVRRLVCRRDADARRLVEAAASGRHLSLRHRDGILRGVDLRRWRADAMVRQFLEFGIDRRHRAPADGSPESFKAMGGTIARRRLPALQCAYSSWGRALF